MLGIKCYIIDEDDCIIKQCDSFAEAKREVIKLTKQGAEGLIVLFENNDRPSVTQEQIVNELV